MGSYSPPRILFIDAFDSFTNNVIGLLEQSIQADVTVVRINNRKFADGLESFLPAFDAVVIGPGPGNPANPEDVGFIDRLWSLSDELTLPVLGICLGHQSLCLNHGAKVTRLSEPRHGIVSKIVHNGTDIFEGVGELTATQYHSLHVDLGHPDHEVFWAPTTACPSIYPLAWGPEDRGTPVLMGARHTEKPFWSVQFHPESICTTKQGAQKIVSNWWYRAQEWNDSNNRAAAASYTNDLEELVHDHENITKDTFSTLASKMLAITGGSQLHSAPYLTWKAYQAKNVSPDALCEALCFHDDATEVVLLDSQGHKGERGTFSILGLVHPQETLKVTYKVDDRRIRWGTNPGANDLYELQLDSIDHVWPVLQKVLDAHNPTAHDSFGQSFPTDIPFWGGFAGYISYEAGLETIQVDSNRPSEIPDINFAFIQRSIVINHEQGLVYVQSLHRDDSAWVAEIGVVIDQLEVRGQCTAEQDQVLQQAIRDAQVIKPQGLEYKQKVLDCQELLRSGDSYELCLTDQTEIRLPSVKYANASRHLYLMNEQMLTHKSRSGESPSRWNLYKRLRQMNPAPFGTFLRLNGVTVVGSSPERFLSWDRTGHCQFRPIKGTVKKSDFTRKEAYEILGSSKEQAENLMIVDLIRHDLSGVVGANNTWVSKLMVVEEYATVYQLVSVIEGQCTPSNPASDKAATGPRGLDVLRASLPPGSMTGAPKKRSCEILRDLEPRNRGIYSGVLGYLDVGGGGDLSVVIRTAISVDASSNADKSYVGKQNVAGIDPSLSTGNTYRIGAGGAVTIQSTAEGEFTEMDVKLSSVLGAFSASGKDH